MGTLVLVRHGQSEWNLLNVFTGWQDPDITEQGRTEAVDGGKALAAAGLLPDVAHTSLLRRAITTCNLALDACDREWIPVHRHWRLNERHYGALQGLNKKETEDTHGTDQFLLWRRSYDVPPPPVATDSPHHPINDPRYADVAPELLPATECLADVLVRVLPYWYDAIVPQLHEDKTVLVAAHGNSLRALVKHLLNISDAEIPSLEIPTGKPWVFQFNDDFTVKSEAYL
ncbi:MAG TPA: 2,3-diphosphoglycerate-dependent phosphoglycerate mutase [Acidimicrobiales bacterium]|nr:2,3-diphosphoglycerate-dependent phosphoglycerate mutase [Acidimicrobiales bacterium]